MTRDQFPWPDMTTEELLPLVMGGMNAHEIATVAGVPDDVGAFMRCHVLGIPAPRSTHPAGCPQVFGVRLAA